ncbi:MAG: signal peptidase I, partial [Patescibacteria group bacterium]
SGQFLIVDRLSYRFEEPKRNDVIVFKYPNNPSVYYIKRIIGLPGDTVNVGDGIITITNQANPNGFVLDQSYLAQNHLARDTFEVELKPSEYFVMGDNRNQSSDSRIWGALDRKLIVGRPVIRLLPVPVISLWPGEDKIQ